MSTTLVDKILRDGRAIIAERGLRLRGGEAVDTNGAECDPCGADARRYCAVGALICAAFRLVGDRELAHRLGWQIAAEIAEAADLPRVEGDEIGWALAALSDCRGQAAVLRAIDVCIDRRRR